MEKPTTRGTIKLTLHKVFSKAQISKLESMGKDFWFANICSYRDFRCHMERKEETQAHNVIF